MILSKFTPYAIGQVAMDKEPDTWEIDVYLTEHLTSTTGDVTEVKQLQGVYKDMKNKTTNYNIERANTVRATWMPMGNYNRLSAPDICKGEFVILWNYSGEDNYYWTEFNQNLQYRKKETALYFFSNKSESIGDDSNQLQQAGYYFLVDTLNQQIVLKTDMGENEKACYLFKIDTQNGIVSLLDSEDNSITLDSTKKEYTITTGEKVNINTKHISIASEEDIVIKTKNTTVDSEKSIKSTTDEYNLTTNKKYEILCKENNGLKIKGANGNVELVKMLNDLVDEHIKLVQNILAIQCNGNLGIAAPLLGSSVSQFQQNLQKYQQYKQQLAKV